MKREYQLNPTSRDTAEVEPIVLTHPDDPGAGLTRRVLKPLIINNEQDPDLPLKAWLLHQRRRYKDEPWDDIEFVDLRTLKGDEQVRIELKSRELKRLYDHLPGLYARAQAGVPAEQQPFIVIDTDQAAGISDQQRAMLRDLLEQAGSEFWQAIDDLRPDLLKAAALTRIHKDREAAL